jgi:predicted RNase H-like nuclease (RuvC/YqgF family)
MSESYEKARERISNQRASSLMDADKTIKQLQSSLAAKEARIAELEEALQYIKAQCLNIPSTHIYAVANTALVNKEVTK